MSDGGALIAPAMATEPIDRAALDVAGGDGAGGDGAGGDGASSLGSQRSRRWLTGMMIALLLVNIFAYLDRQILFIMAEDVKHDLGLSDTQLGLLGGLGFALVYSIFSLPVAWLADRFSPSKIIALAILIWSVMTSASGLAQNFTQLLIGRFGVSAGEAGSSSPAHAIIGSYFPASQRTRMIALFSLGGPVGMGIGLAAAGFLQEAIGWRLTFILLGLPGVVLALVMWFAVRIPTVSHASGQPVSWRHSIGAVLKSRAYRQITIGGTIYTVAAFGTQTFFPVFLIRTQGLPVTTVGFWLGLAYGLGGGAGILLGGALGDWVGKRRPYAKLWIAAGSLFAAAPFALAGLLVTNGMTSLLLLSVPLFACSFFIPVMWATIQDIAPTGARATASAVFALVCTMVGGSGGPYLIGMASDMLTPEYGIASLRYALMIAVVAYAWAGVHFTLATLYLRSDWLARAPRG